jgi:hypothetical protein
VILLEVSVLINGIDVQVIDRHCGRRAPLVEISTVLQYQKFPNNLIKAQISAVGGRELNRSYLQLFVR